MTGLAGGGTAFALYVATAATTYTWANDGADGGDLLVAAATNGIPHPPGYPLYTLLLRAVLNTGAFFFPALEPAVLGNLFSAAAAAVAVALTTLTVHHLLTGHGHRDNPARVPAPVRDHGWRGLAIAFAAGLAFGTTPLLWSQAIITEVYALHAVWVAGLGLAVATRAKPLWVVLLIGGGLAHHLTFALLLPAALYAWSRASNAAPSGIRPRNVFPPVYPTIFLTLGGGIFLALLFYLRLPLAAGWFFDTEAWTPPPVLWGFPDNWSGLWWLISGTPYREFVFGVPLLQWPARLVSAFSILVQQYTLVGALLALWGLFRLCAPSAPARTAILLWIVPTLFYAITYNTADSYIYLLPVAWLVAIAAAWGTRHVFDAVNAQMQVRFGIWTHIAPPLIVCALVLILIGVRLPGQSLRHDRAARQYIEATAAVVTPQSLLVTGTDAHTFALWYATWGSAELAARAPGIMPLNIELYEHAWYQRLLRQRYPDLEAVGAPFPTFLEQNAAMRDIWLSEPFEGRLPGATQTEGVLWRYLPE